MANNHKCDNTLMLVSSQMYLNHIIGLHELVCMNEVSKPDDQKLLSVTESVQHHWLHAVKYLSNLVKVALFIQYLHSFADGFNVSIHPIWVTGAKSAGRLFI